MKPIRQFESFIKAGIVKKQFPDKSRAEFLVKESEKGLKTLSESISKIPINKDNANNYIKMCYDIMMELIRAKMLLQGYNASGQGAHESEVSYLRKLNFKEAEVQFLDQIRFFRNGMIYYGTSLDKEYAEKVVKFLKDIYPKLKKIFQ